MAVPGRDVRHCFNLVSRRAEEAGSLHNSFFLFSLIICC